MPTVGPITETHVRLVYDSDSNGLGGPLDMTGPDIGEVVYSQDAGDDLKVTIHLEFGWPGTTYQVFLVGGPSHALGTGYTTIGTLTTNAVGAGTATFLVPFAVLQNHPPYGPGYRTDHIDMLVRVGDESRGGLTAGAINYFVCGKQAHPGATGAMAQRPVRSVTGDPHAGQKSSTDPGAGGGSPKKGKASRRR